jgi:hypothetical protein
LGNYREGVNALYSTLQFNLQNAAEKLGLALADDTPASQFANLLKNARQKFNAPTVVIIDEYDKPLLATIAQPEIHRELREALKGFYGVLKSADEYLRFSFLTGVTKFSHVSIFSDLNQLKDISLHPQYADLCGWTQAKVESNFAPEIAEISNNFTGGRAAYLAKVKDVYNGYRISEKPLTVYNPFGLLHHFSNGGEFASYWFQSGTPTFLLKLINEQKIDALDLEGLRVTDADFQKYDLETLRAAPVLYQSGYLTIVDYDEGEYQLDYPNTEVRASFAKSLIEGYLRVGGENQSAFFLRFWRAFREGHPQSALEALQALMVAIPYDIIPEGERYYQTVVHLAFTMLGLNCRSEVRLSAGRIDTLVEIKYFVYCFEFKLNGTAAVALAQIDTKEYLLPWRGSGKKLFKTGASFDFDKRNLAEWQITEGV